MNMSKYQPYQILSLYLQKWQGYRALKNTYYVEIYNFLKNLHQNTPACQIWTFHLEKYQSYKAFHVSHYDVIMTSYKPWTWK